MKLKLRLGRIKLRKGNCRRQVTRVASSPSSSAAPCQRLTKLRRLWASTL